MTVCRFLFSGIMLFVVLFPVLSAHSGYEDKDLIHITHSKNKLFAFSEKKGITTFELRLKEKVLWKSSKGRLGAALTDHRLLVITSDLPRWTQHDLYLKESKEIKPYLSRSMLLVVSKVRAIAFSLHTLTFQTLSFSLKEQIRDVDLNRHLAALLTSERAVAFSPLNGTFQHINYGLREVYEHFELKKKMVIITTDLRFLTYSTANRKWVEVRRDF